MVQAEPETEEETVKPVTETTIEPEKPKEPEVVEEIQGEEEENERSINICSCLYDFVLTFSKIAFLVLFFSLLCNFMSPDDHSVEQVLRNVPTVLVEKFMYVYQNGERSLSDEINLEDSSEGKPIGTQYNFVPTKGYFSAHTGTFKGKTWTIDLKDGKLKNEMGISVYKGTWGLKHVIFKAESQENDVEKEEPEENFSKSKSFPPNKEAQFMIELGESPCFPKFYGMVEKQTIMMEEKSGRPLNTLFCDDSELAQSYAPDLFTNLKSCVKELIKKNIMHGDLHAHNVLYSGSNVAIIDFDRATRFGEEFKRSHGYVCHDVPIFDSEMLVVGKEKLSLANAEFDMHTATQLEKIWENRIKGIDPKKVQEKEKAGLCMKCVII